MKAIGDGIGAVVGLVLVFGGPIFFGWLLFFADVHWIFKALAAFALFPLVLTIALTILPKRG